MRDRILVIILSFLLMAAWGEVQLYAELAEEEANEILYALLSHNISCSKSSEKAGFVVTVDSVHLARAIKLLNAFGLPRKKFVDMGDVFDQQGLVASPMEEKARFIYATSQELSETISNIDGVLIARVHIVLPTENTVGEVLFPSSSSVFIKYIYGADVAALVPKIKLLVANSIEGLNEREVSITLFEADIVRLDSIPLQPISYFWLYIIIGSVSTIIVIGVVVFVWFRQKRQHRTSSPEARKINPIQAMRNKLQDSTATTNTATNMKTKVTTPDIQNNADQNVNVKEKSTNINNTIDNNDTNNAS